QQREWRRHIRPVTGRWWGPSAPRPPVGYATQMFAGVMLPVITVVRTLLFWLFLCVLASLLSTNALFGWPTEPDVPLWAAVLFAVLAYMAVAWPLAAIRRA